MFSRNKDRVSEEFWISHNGQLLAICRSPSIAWVMKLRLLLSGYLYRNLENAHYENREGDKKIK